MRGVCFSPGAPPLRGPAVIICSSVRITDLALIIRWANAERPQLGFSHVSGDTER